MTEKSIKNRQINYLRIFVNLMTKTTTTTNNKTDFQRKIKRSNRCFYFRNAENLFLFLVFAFLINFITFLNTFEYLKIVEIDCTYKVINSPKLFETC